MRGIPKKRRRPKLLACALAVLAIGAVVAPAAAVPPTITDDLDSGPQGWELYLTSGERDLDWSPSGGNPGGYVGAAVDDPASEDAAFGDAGYVSNMSRYAGDPIAFDMRSNLETGRRPTVWLYDYYYERRLLRARVSGPAVGTEWNSYLLPLEAANETHWFNKRGERVSKRRFNKVLRGDPSFVVEADLSAAPGERTDLDNPGIVGPVERTVNLRYVGKRDRFKGRVRSPEEPACSSDQNVQIIKRVDGGTRVFSQVQTDTAGRFSSSKRPKRGRYFARVIESTAPLGNDCLAARSKTVRAR